LARKILLADDSVTAQNMGRKILADAGYEVVTVNNGSAALKKIAELKPDLVILDVYMPGYSGLEVCQRLKESQESSRIPVLLTVGKLEPFKPEEAHRVRAEGFIVKPFEASELLSALSKLEDKVVPRAEASKPGRFARAIAAAEEAGRISRNDAASADNGWKSRIAFPHEKAVEENVAEEASIYNPVNRDLRTVVESSAKAEDNRAEFQGKQPQTGEASVDVAALAPRSLPRHAMPQDVTLEEVTAIAAAAAQIQMAATVQDQPQSSVTEIAATNASPEVPSNSAPAVDPEAQAQSVAEAKQIAADEASSGLADFRGGLDENSDESKDLPVTMAAGNGNGSRWTAIAVALETDEAAISLEQEMKKAYSALVAEESGSANVPPLPDIVPAETFFPASEAKTETPANTIFSSAPDPLLQPRHIMPADAPSGETASAERAHISPSNADAASVTDTEPANVPQVETLSSTNAEAAVIAPSESASQKGTAETSPEFSEPSREPVAEPVSSALEETVTPAATHEAEPAMAETVTASSDAPASTTPTERAEERVDENKNKEERKEESETVKTTAAAWASWRQIRDTNDPRPAAEPESNMPEAALTESAAMAVAAGAEQNAQEIPATATENPTDVASIVDSVLADLRPRLMAEITRKMSEKK
jgi:CheY-like chemotaxis protein